MRHDPLFQRGRVRCPCALALSLLPYLLLAFPRFGLRDCTAIALDDVLSEASQAGILVPCVLPSPSPLFGLRTHVSLSLCRSGLHSSGIVNRRPLAVAHFRSNYAPPLRHFHSFPQCAFLSSSPLSSRLLRRSRSHPPPRPKCRLRRRRTSPPRSRCTPTTSVRCASSASVSAAAAATPAAAPAAAGRPPRVRRTT